jgi:hypothetical protein
MLSYTAVEQEILSEPGVLSRQNYDRPPAINLYGECHVGTNISSIIATATASISKAARQHAGHSLKNIEADKRVVRGHTHTVAPRPPSLPFLLLLLLLLLFIFIPRPPAVRIIVLIYPRLLGGAKRAGPGVFRQGELIILLIAPDPKSTDRT